MIGAFLASFLQYLIIFIFLIAIGVGGCFAGRALRKRKDEKEAAEKAQEEKQNLED